MDDDWLRFFPAGSLDTRADLHRGLAEQFSLFLQRMEELPLAPAHPDQPLVIRLLCLPTWSPACCVRIETGGMNWRLIGKELDCEAGFDVGELVSRENRLLSASESDQVEELWQYLRFWSLPTQGKEDVFDGTTYVLEAVQNGQYHVAHRDDPEWGDTFGEFCDLLLRFATFAPR